MGITKIKKLERIEKEAWLTLRESYMNFSVVKVQLWEAERDYKIGSQDPDLVQKGRDRYNLIKLDYEQGRLTYCRAWTTWDDVMTQLKDAKLDALIIEENKNETT